MDIQVKGSPQEERELRAVVQRYCECSDEDAASGTRICSLHTMLSGATRADRRVLDGLLFVRRVLVPRLLAQEFGPGPMTQG
jgi:hypothetical protein